MRITNKFGLPDAIVRAVTNDPYTKGGADFSLSELIGPARKAVLEKRHWNEIEEDVSDRVWSLFGQAVHHIAERANVEDIVERRLKFYLLGKSISGAMDNYDPKKGILTDYKTASVFKFSFNDFKDWEEQQNCYAQLLRWNGDKIEKLQIVAFLKDWRTREAREAERLQKPYPNKAELVQLPLWPEAQAIAFLEERVIAHSEAKNALPECSAEERWARPSTWAIKKRGAARAIPGGIFAIESFARVKLKELGKDFEVEHRPGINQRCENYCAAAPFCDQYKKLKSGIDDAGQSA